MRQDRVWLLLMALAGVVAAESASASQEIRLAQTQPAPGIQRERAPGVPMAPRGADFDHRIDERDRSPAIYRTQRDERARAQQGADSDIPMPRGVPSIIAP